MTIPLPTAGTTSTTSAGSVTVAGPAADNAGVTQVTWTNRRGRSGVASGTTSWTASGVPLQTGTNVLTITPQDAAGHAGTDTVTVTRN